MYRTLGILVFLFLGVTSLKADPVVITGGTLVFNQGQANPFTLTGQGTVINGLNSSLSQVMGSTVLVVGGRQVTLNLPLDSQDGEVNASFPITVGGVTYNSGHIILLQLSTNPVTFVVPGPANGFTVTAPLSLTRGFVAGYNGIGFTDEFFSSSLTGEGTQVFTFRYCTACFNPGLTVFFLESWTGTFGAVAPGVTVQTIPEPTSMFLLVTSMTALSWMRRKWKE
jgi:hypothetical protein